MKYRGSILFIILWLAQLLSCYLTVASVCHTNCLTLCHIIHCSWSHRYDSKKKISPQEETVHDSQREIYCFLPGNYCHTVSQAAKAFLIHRHLSRAALYSVRISTAHTSNSSNFKKQATLRSN